MLSTLSRLSQKDIGKDEIIVERMNYWICERIICSNLSTIVVPYYQSYSQPKHPEIFIEVIDFNIEHFLQYLCYWITIQLSSSL